MPRPGGSTHSTNPSYTQQEIDDVLTAYIAHDGNATAAKRYLTAEGKHAPGATTIASWARTKHWQRYEELRESVAPQLEQTAANNMREILLLSQEGTRMALEQEMERLRKGKELDPARAAANMARVSQSSVDKLMTLTQRPTSIQEVRDPYASLRKLVAMGVLQAPPELPEIEPGESE